MKVERVEAKLLDDACRSSRGECTLCGLAVKKEESVRRFCDVCQQTERVHKDCSAREWLT